MGAIEGQITEDLHPAIGGNTAQALPLLLQPPLLLLFGLNRRGFVAVQLTQKRLGSPGSRLRPLPPRLLLKARAQHHEARMVLQPMALLAAPLAVISRALLCPGRQRILLIQQRRIEGKATGGAVGRSGAIGGRQRQHLPHPHPVAAQQLQPLLRPSPKAPAWQGGDVQQHAHLTAAAKQLAQGGHGCGRR